LFGYDTGVAGGVVQSKYFQIKFGVRPVEGPVKQSRIDDVSANVVSALQGGAFFGALSSAPVSAWIGRRKTLLAYTVIFAVGAVRNFSLVPPLGPMLTCAGTGIANDRKWRRPPWARVYL
jgi:MFS family permease